MNLRPTSIDQKDIPHQLLSYMSEAKLYDSSCSPEAKTIFIEKDEGYFLKIAPKDSLRNDSVMTEYFNLKGLSARVCEYLSLEQDYLVTQKITGQDGIAPKYLDHPEKLCDVFAESLFQLHNVDFSDCPIKNKTISMLSDVKRNRPFNQYDEHLLKYIDLSDKTKAYRLLENKKDILKNDALLHGDYCLPNILLNDFKLSGFIDVGNGGVGDRHYDIFWGIWTLQYNLHTNAYKDRFLDCYGRELIDMQRLTLCGIISALTW
ncbi:MAG: aminoglycoside 3'-phosphotransferase [Oscillospiraceae bacterium]